MYMNLNFLNSLLALLMESVFVEYARHLLHLGNPVAVEYYCSKAGEKGKALAEEMKNLIGNK
jgi:hypothetical protein